MRLSFSPLVALTSTLIFLPYVSAIRYLATNSLNTCQEDSDFTASLFNVVFTPDNATFTFHINGISTVSANVTFQALVQAYGYTIINATIDPCTLGVAGMCPMGHGTINLDSWQNVSQSVVKNIPSIAFGVPDFDALVTVNINTKTAPITSLACVQARVSNGQTVDQKGVSWATAVVAGLGLASSAIVSGLGHSNTAAHVAHYALTLFNYFQAVAIVGLVAVPLPPIVQSWTQDFQWTMGIIEVDFLQSIATWYQTSTGGTPATVLNTLATTSVQVLKRSGVVKRSAALATRAWAKTPKFILKRTNYQNHLNAVTGTYVVKGMNRVAFRAGMEATNLFLTGLIFFCCFVTFTIIGVLLFKGFCELAVKMRWMQSDKFQDFRNGWQIVLKGIMFRIVLIGWVQMTILCLWEFTQGDSPAEIVLAVFFFFGMGGTLGWAAFKVISLARRSQLMHKNPAYILYSDPTALNKWGFLYVQFRATAYYYIVPIFIYILVKAMFVSLGQPNGVVQSIGLVIIEAIVLIGTSVVRPYMDKPTNTIGIAVAAINFLNAIFLLVFSDVFGQPALATGIMGVLFFIFNAVFALVLLIFVLVMSILSLVRKNPDNRYQPMIDDRASFIKSQTALTTELDALGATARGDGKGVYKGGLDLDDDDNESWSSDSLRQKEATNQTLPPSTANSNREPPHSPIDPSTPFLGATGPSNSRSGPPNYAENNRPYGYSLGAESRPNSDLPLLTQGGQMAGSPSPGYSRGGSSQSNVAPAFRAQNNASPSGYRSQNNASPWQRGAGYDH
ncbi:MAG: hypothetical protein M1818_006300 [Claussenomyces sp. TS43310]|nr:MAG: hypothetical protein M1818_006300 [Claussenomyces sp. TS43310]